VKIPRQKERENPRLFPIADIPNFLYIRYVELIFIKQKSRHMKKNTQSMHVGTAAQTILLAVAFLGLVMFLSYLFITGNS